MADQTEHTPPPVPVPTPVAFPTDSVPMSEKEVGEGKAMAVISYVLNFPRFPFWLVPLIMRNNDFALYHAKQCMTLWILAWAAHLVCAPFLLLFCVGVPLEIAVFIGAVVLNIIGLINAINGKAKPLPLIGGFGEKWFRGIHKVPA